MFILSMFSEENDEIRTTIKEVFESGRHGRHGVVGRLLHV